ncbi:hypothetical protein [Niallia circulans]|uniref:hypothetical protein n=1 Tax=Niallia circulans TaxID=1397 RepID=UPI0026EE18E8|nr:hypothetical protein [Niallia circulans]
MSFMLAKDSKDLHTAWYTLVETTDGRKLTVKDSNAPVGMMEAETRYKAIKKGKEFLERMKEKLKDE